MLIKEARCPECGSTFIVDHKLWAVGAVRLRCVTCGHYFPPAGSPRSMSTEEAANAAVEIQVWEPPEAAS